MFGNGFDHLTVTLALDDRKVFQRFGDRLAKGVPLRSFTANRFAGMVWSQWRKRFVPNKVAVPLMMTGRRVKPGSWEFVVPAAAQHEVIFWLQELCAAPITEHSGAKFLGRRRHGKR